MKDSDNFLRVLRDARMKAVKTEVRDQLVQYDIDLSNALAALHKNETTENMQTAVSIWSRAYLFVAKLVSPGPTDPTSGTPDLPDNITEALSLPAIAA